MTAENIKKLVDANVVFLHHSVRFPVLQLPNTPEAFGLPENTSKKLLTLGRYKAIPDSVWVDVFDQWDKTPVYKLGIVRSRLQAFIDQNTTDFLFGSFRALPMKRVEPFMAIASVLEKDFKDAKAEYLEHFQTLKERSLSFWEKEAPKLFQIPAHEVVSAVSKVLSNDVKFSRSFNFVTCAVTLDSLDTGAMSVAGASTDIVTQSINRMDEAMNQLLIDSVKGQREEIQKAFAELYEKVDTGKFNQKSVNAIKRVLNGFKEMNYMNDKALEKFVEAAYEKLSKLEIKKIKGKGQEKAFADFSDYIGKQKAIIDALQEEGVDDVIDAFIGTSKKDVEADIDEPEVQDNSVFESDDSTGTDKPVQGDLFGDDPF